MSNLNIRMPGDLKERLDSFAAMHGVQTSTLVIAELEAMLKRGIPNKSVILPTPGLERKIKIAIQELGNAK